MERFLALQKQIASVAAVLGDSEHLAILRELENELRHQSTMRLSSQRAHFRSSFIAKASKLLAGSLDYRTTLSTVVRLLVPDLADWAAVDMVQPDGSVARLEAVHREETRSALVRDLQQHYAAESADPVSRAIRSGDAELVSEVPGGILELLAQNEHHLHLLRQVGMRSYIVAPLKARGQTLGAISVVMSDSQRHYDEADLAMIEELAAVAALAIDNSRLYREAEDSARQFRDLVDSLGAIVWEGDAQTFQFSFISKRAEDILGYPVEDWLKPGFWASILAPGGRDWAINYCVTATKEGRDHEFEYAAIAADGRTVWLRDIVYVVRDEDGRAVQLRGVMVPLAGPSSPENEG